MKESATARWQNLRNPQYLRFAVPGVLLIVMSFVFWGDGWWARVLLFVGLALVTLPYPRLPADRA